MQDLILVVAILCKAIGIATVTAILTFLTFRFFGSPLPEISVWACAVSAVVPSFIILLSKAEF